jgi:hypothetical protein
MFVCCECCVLSGRGFCDELITRLEESCRLWSVVLCDLENSRMRRPWPALGRSATKKKSFYSVHVLRYSKGTRGLNWESPYTNNFVLNHTDELLWNCKMPRECPHFTHIIQLYVHHTS